MEAVSVCRFENQQRPITHRNEPETRIEKLLSRIEFGWLSE